jgi:hypothetical protein
MCVCGEGGELTSSLLPRNEQGTLKNYGSIMKCTVNAYLYVTVSNSHGRHSEVKLLRKSFRNESNYHNISKLQG